MDARTLATVMGNRLSLSRYKQLTPEINQALVEADCTTVNRVAMFCAQISAESGGLTWTEELASGEEYNWRSDLGNTQPGDGPRFKGRSFIQITGRHNYTSLSVWAHNKGYVPTSHYFVDHPSYLAHDAYAFLGPVWYWTVARPQLNRLADARDIYDATLAVNGGTNGLDERTERWHVALNQGDKLLPEDTLDMHTVRSLIVQGLRAAYNGQNHGYFTRKRFPFMVDGKGYSGHIADLQAEVASLKKSIVTLQKKVK